MRRPAGTLWFRLFVWFWMSSMAIGVLLVDLMMLQGDTPLAWIRVLRHAAPDVAARAAVMVYETRGVGGLSAYFAELRGDGLLQYLFDAEGRELSGATAPEEAQQLARDHSPGIHHRMARRRRSMLIGMEVRGNGEARYVYVAEPGRAPVLGPLFGWREFALRIGFVAVVSGLLCYLLARWLASPLGELRRATLRFAGGDLEARADAAAFRGAAEISALAGEFNRMAERIRDSVLQQRRFFQDVSHELRSPLTRLGLAAGLARRKSLGGDTAELDRIERETARLQRLVAGILSMAAMDRDFAAEEKHRIEIGELLRGVVEDCNYACRDREAPVVLREPFSKAWLVANEQQLRGAFENVMLNAVRYSPPGTAVEVGCERNGNGELRVAVCDRGPGVPEEALGQIFEPFYRSGLPDDANPDGLGLGLAITHRAVALIGGSVTARNRAGGGLEVEFRFQAGRD